MVTVSFTRSTQNNIDNLQNAGKVQDGVLYFATDTGHVYVGLPDNVLAMVRMDVQNALNVATYVIAEGDTDNGVWHYRFYSNGYVDYDGTLTLNDVYFSKRIGTSFYGSSQEDVQFPHYPVSLSTISFKKAEAFPACLTQWTNVGQNIITTLSSAPLTSADTGKYMSFGVLNCFRPSALTEEYAQNIVYGVKTSGYVIKPDDVSALESQQPGLYKARVLKAIAAYNETSLSQEVK